jgi:cell division protein FtsQ
MLKKIWTHVKWSRIAWSLAAATAVFLSLRAVSYRDTQKLATVAVNINHDGGMLFVDTADVADIMSEQRVYPGATLLQSVPCRQLEKMLEGNPYCKDAEVYVDALGALHADLQQRVPVLRIMNRNGVGYYVDSTGMRLPLHDNFTPRVLAANGFITASDNNADTTGLTALNNLRLLAMAIERDTFLSRLVDQVSVNGESEAVLVPKFVGQEILFGDATHVQDKLAKLKSFYHTTAKTTLSNYKRIDLRFANEVYAMRRDHVAPQPVIKTVSDTTNASRQVATGKPASRNGVTNASRSTVKKTANTHTLTLQ